MPPSVSSDPYTDLDDANEEIIRLNRHITRMEQSERYNGWTNYATWRINLDIIEDYADSLHRDRERFADTSDLATRLEEIVDDYLTKYGEDDEHPAVSYARAFVSAVNWCEIADHYPDVIETDEPADPESDDYTEAAERFNAALYGEEN